MNYELRNELIFAQTKLYVGENIRFSFSCTLFHSALPSLWPRQQKGSTNRDCRMLLHIEGRLLKAEVGANMSDSQRRQQFSSLHNT